MVCEGKRSVNHIKESDNLDHSTYHILPGGHIHSVDGERVLSFRPGFDEAESLLEFPLEGRAFVATIDLNVGVQDVEARALHDGLFVSDSAYHLSTLLLTHTLDPRGRWWWHINDAFASLGLYHTSVRNNAGQDC